MRNFLVPALSLLTAAAVCPADPCQVDRLVAPGPFAPTSFGNSIAHSGDYWFIADYRAQVLCTGFGCGAGAVYVYEIVKGELVYVQTLTSPFPQSPDNYGISIDANDDMLVVGARYSAVPSRADRPGAVFVYTLEADRWEQAAIVEPPEGSAAFGTIVSLDGNTLAAADYDNDRIFVYEIDGASWQLTDELLPPPEVSAMSAFGWSMVAADDMIVVGAPYDRSVIGAGGSFHVYREVSPGQYEIEHSEYSDVQQLLGTAIAIDGEEILVAAMAATRDFEQQGVVYRYRNDGPGWNKIGELVSEQAAFRAGFGAHLELDHNTLAVTADNELAVYIMQQSIGGNWNQTGRIRPDTTTFPYFFGFELALQGNTLFVGAPSERDTIGSTVYGAAYQFDLSCNPCPSDLDADGSLTIFDFLTFLNLFQDGSSEADFDGDGELTIFDFLAFQTAFDAGCE